MVLRIVVAGVGGRMGREVVTAAEGEDGVEIVGGTIRPGPDGGLPSWQEVVGRPSAAARIFAGPEEAAAAGDVVIDFTAPAGAVAGARACADAGVPFVSGTTGLMDGEMDALRAAAERVPVFYARNMSAGVAAVGGALALLARELADYDAEIVECHHRHKADAPSGTALALAEVIAGARGVDLEQEASFGRHGAGRRRRGEIGIHAVRAGGNAGEHTIIFGDEGEEVRLVHRAFGRRAFARGALRAARFVAEPGRRPGLYGATDLAGFTTV